jgi:hypothetical protein
MIKCSVKGVWLDGDTMKPAFRRGIRIEEGDDEREEDPPPQSPTERSIRLDQLPVDFSREGQWFRAGSLRTGRGVSEPVIMRLLE